MARGRLVFSHTGSAEDQEGCMEGARKESLANSADGGCPASLLLQPAIKIYSVKLLVYFFRPE